MVTKSTFDQNLISAKRIYMDSCNRLLNANYYGLLAVQPLREKMTILKSFFNVLNLYSFSSGSLFLGNIEVTDDTDYNRTIDVIRHFADRNAPKYLTVSKQINASPVEGAARQSAITRDYPGGLRSFRTGVSTLAVADQAFLNGVLLPAIDWTVASGVFVYTGNKNLLESDFISIHFILS